MELPFQNYTKRHQTCTQFLIISEVILLSFQVASSANSLEYKSMDGDILKNHRWSRPNTSIKNCCTIPNFLHTLHHWTLWGSKVPSLWPKNLWVASASWVITFFPMSPKSSTYCSICIEWSKQLVVVELLYCMVAVVFRLNLIVTEGVFVLSWKSLTQFSLNVKMSITVIYNYWLYKIIISCFFFFFFQAHSYMESILAPSADTKILPWFVKSGP